MSIVNTCVIDDLFKIDKWHKVPPSLSLDGMFKMSATDVSSLLLYRDSPPCFLSDKLQTNGAVPSDVTYRVRTKYFSYPTSIGIYKVVFESILTDNCFSIKTGTEPPDDPEPVLFISIVVPTSVRLLNHVKR